jgi:hypothetical protein
MYCSHLQAPNDDQLLAHILGEETLNDESEHHLKHCSLCQEQLKEYLHINHILLSQYRTFCPNTKQLALYCAYALPTDDMFVIAEHLRECSLCNKEVKDLHYEMLHFNPFPDLPMTPFGQAKRKLKQFLARPITQTAQILRRENLLSSWPCYYETENFLLSLHLSRTSKNQIMLLGIFDADNEEQISTLEGSTVELYPLEQESASPELSPAQSPLMSTTINLAGHFFFSPLLAGTYTIHIHLPDAEPLIEKISLDLP